MNVIKCNGYHIPTDTIFSTHVRPTECSVTMAVGSEQFTFQLPETEVRPILEKAGFFAFDNGIFINPKNVAYLLEGETDIMIFGHFGRAVHLYSRSNIDRALEIFYPKKKVK